MPVVAYTHIPQRGSGQTVPLVMGPSGIVGYEPVGDAIREADMILAIDPACPTHRRRAAICSTGYQSFRWISTRQRWAEITM